MGGMRTPTHASMLLAVGSQSSELAHPNPSSGGLYRLSIGTQIEPRRALQAPSYIICMHCLLPGVSLRQIVSV